MTYLVTFMSNHVSVDLPSQEEEIRHINITACDVAGSNGTCIFYRWLRIATNASCHLKCMMIISARQHKLYAIARYMLSPVRSSVCPSHG